MRAHLAIVQEQQRHGGLLQHGAFLGALRRQVGGRERVVVAVRCEPLPLACCHTSSGYSRHMPGFRGSCKAALTLGRWPMHRDSQSLPGARKKWRQGWGMSACASSRPCFCCNGKGRTSARGALVAGGRRVVLAGRLVGAEAQLRGARRRGLRLLACIGITHQGVAHPRGAHSLTLTAGHTCTGMGQHAVGMHAMQWPGILTCSTAERYAPTSQYSDYGGDMHSEACSPINMGCPLKTLRCT